jgi:hypothetical protein
MDQKTKRIIKKPTCYTPPPTDFIDDLSIDSNWEEISISDNDNNSLTKNKYDYTDPFLAKDDEIEYIDGYSSTDEERSLSDRDTTDDEERSLSDRDTTDDGERSLSDRDTTDDGEENLSD